VVRIASAHPSAVAQRVLEASAGAKQR
jgi:hypothetical protein